MQKHEKFFLVRKLSWLIYNFVIFCFVIIKLCYIIILYVTINVMKLVIYFYESEAILP